jgi:hypothetical protein
VPNLERDFGIADAQPAHLTMLSPIATVVNRMRKKGFPEPVSICSLSR